MAVNNYVVGKGKLFFDQFLQGQRQGTNTFRYFGNTPTLDVTRAATALDHYTAEGGVKQKDDSVDIETNITGKFTCDNISGPNLALWFGGISLLSPQILSAAPIQETPTVFPDSYYQVGRTVANPQGTTVIGGYEIAVATAATPGTAAVPPTPAVAATPGSPAVAPIPASNGNPAVPGTPAVPPTPAVAANPGSPAVPATPAGTRPLLEGVDFTVDSVSGMIFFPAEGFVNDRQGTPVQVSYYTEPSEQEVVIEQGTAIYGALKFYAINPKGQNRDYYYPYVKMSASGTFALKGDTWQACEFTYEALKLNDQTQRVYITAR